MCIHNLYKKYAVNAYYYSFVAFPVMTASLGFNNLVKFSSHWHPMRRRWEGYQLSQDAV